MINRLEKRAFGEISLTIIQLRAIEILLRKSIPDLAAVEIKSEQTHRYVVEVPPLLDRDEWQRRYGHVTAAGSNPAQGSPGERYGLYRQVARLRGGEGRAQPLRHFTGQPGA